MKKLPAVRLVEREDAAKLPDLPEQVRLAKTEVAAVAREGLLAMSVAVGLRVMGELLQAEPEAKVGPVVWLGPSACHGRTDPPGAGRGAR